MVAPQIGITDNLVDALAGYAITHRLYVAGAYLFHFATFDPFPPATAATMAPLFDGAEHDAEVAFTYRVTRLDDFKLAGRFQHFSAGPQHESIPIRWDLGNSYSPVLGWRHQFVREVEATIEGGPLFYQALAGAVHIPGAPQQSGTTWRLAARLRYYTPSWRAGLAFTRDLLGATGDGSALWADSSTRSPTITISRSSSRTRAAAISATAPRSIRRGPMTASPPTR